MTCNLTVISLKLTYGSHMWSFATNFSRVIMHPPVCQLGEFCSHSRVCAEKVIRVVMQIYAIRWPRNLLHGLAVWQLDGDEMGTWPFLLSQHICTTAIKEFGNILPALEGSWETESSFPSSLSMFQRLRTRWEIHGLGSKFITFPRDH